MKTWILAVAVIALVLIGCAYAYTSMEDKSEKYVITYDSNGGTGEKSSTKVSAGDKATISENGFDNSSNFRYFTSWNTKEDGSGIDYSPGAVITPADDMTLFAKWRLCTINDWGVGTTYSYDGDGGYSMTIDGHTVQYSFKGTVFNYELVASNQNENTFERSGEFVVSYTDPYTQEYKIQKTPTRDTVVEKKTDLDYKGQSSVLSTKWGSKDVIVVHDTETDGNGNVIQTTYYRDSESFMWYKYEAFCESYRDGANILKDWNYSYVLSDYDIKPSF